MFFNSHFDRNGKGMRVCNRRFNEVSGNSVTFPRKGECIALFFTIALMS